MNISKNDWKLFRERLPGWQERFMNWLLLDYAQMISSDDAASDRFWALDERLKQDKKSPGVLMSPSKSELPWDLARMIRCGVISTLDMDGFSEGLVEGVKQILDFPIKLKHCQKGLIMYCKICGRSRANEKFSGKGHSAHICKDCAKLPLEERNELQTLSRIDNLPFYLSREQRAWLEKKRTDKREHVRNAAKIAFEMRYPDRKEHPVG